ncbi:MAG: hypothetical protein GY859_34550 [Desulfobacterales bacterium]|nr:hypothetical protein [Desulfobacterales bacterium]
MGSMGSSEKSFSGLVREHLGGDLPPQLAGGVNLSSLGGEARDFILRLLDLMRKAGQPVTEFTPLLIWELSTMAPNALPGAFGGRIPPITITGRHRKFDAYIERTAPVPGGGAGVFVDVGCGCPPVTTMDSARNLKGWRVFGVDRGFAPYMVYDSDGSYACFEKDGATRYFQGGRGVVDPVVFYGDPAATRRRFKSAFDRLLPLLSADGNAGSETVEADGYKLIRNAIKDFEREGLTFIEAELGRVDLPPANVVRCMNVLLYFEPETRRRMMARAGAALDEGGVFLAGTNQFVGAYCRYVVYRKENGRLAPAEFAFSPDVLRPLSMMPWYTIHEDEPEAALLAELARAVRGDREFWGDFTRRVDVLLADHGMCRRGDNGFLLFPRERKPPAEAAALMRAIWRQVHDEGYAAGAAEALCRAGYDAFENVVGDVAVRPPAGSFFADAPGE